MFLPAALLLGLMYVFGTPPFTVPDEAPHVWRANGFAQGLILPAARPAAVKVAVEDRLGVLSWHLSDNLYRTGKYGWRELKVAWQLTPDGKKQRVSYAAIYTPVPYIPQVAGLVAATAMNLRPLALFYLGRIANLIFAVSIVAWAMRLAPQSSMILGAAALLPMTLFEFASWSADASAIAFGFLFIAFAMRAFTPDRYVTAGDILGLSVSAFLLGMCKPAYFLLPVIVLTIPRSRFTSGRQRAAMIGAIALATMTATLVAMTYFDRGFFNMRITLPVDPAAQMACIRSAPLHFARVLVNDAITNGRFYVEETIGRFGPNEVKLPPLLIIVNLLLLMMATFTTQVSLPRWFRLAAVTIFAATAGGIMLSQYLIWSPVCGETIDGIQGRYFLPILPLLLLAFSGIARIRMRPALLIAVAAACNVAAMIAQLDYYWW
jgi:uncharacterized membrane protein